MAAKRSCWTVFTSCCRRKLHRPVHVLLNTFTYIIITIARSKVDYDNVLADSEREAVADLLNHLEHVRISLINQFTQRIRS